MTINEEFFNQMLGIWIHEQVMDFIEKTIKIFDLEKSAEEKLELSALKSQQAFFNALKRHEK